MLFSGDSYDGRHLCAVGKMLPFLELQIPESYSWLAWTVTFLIPEHCTWSKIRQMHLCLFLCMHLIQPPWGWKQEFQEHCISCSCNNLQYCPPCDVWMSNAARRPKKACCISATHYMCCWEVLEFSSSSSLPLSREEDGLHCNAGVHPRTCGTENQESVVTWFIVATLSAKHTSLWPCNNFPFKQLSSESRWWGAYIAVPTLSDTVISFCGEPLRCGIASLYSQSWGTARCVGGSSNMFLQSVVPELKQLPPSRCRIDIMPDSGLTFPPLQWNLNNDHLVKYDAECKLYWRHCSKD